MSLLQVQINQELQNAIKKKAKRYGISVSSLIRIVLVQAFLDDKEAGNLFNAKRDNKEKGIPIDDLISML